MYILINMPAWHSLDLGISLIDDVLRPLMNSSADFDVAYAQGFTGNLESIREKVLSKIEATIQGNMMNVNLTGEIDRFLREGLSTLYYNATIGSSGLGTINNDDQMCLIDAAYSYLFPANEQREIATLGNNLEQIRVAYEVARAVSTYCLICMYVCMIIYWESIEQTLHTAYSVYPVASINTFNLQFIKS